MEIKPQLIIVPDEDYEYGLNHGAYPEFDKERSSGEVLVLSKEDARDKYGIVSTKDNQIYVRNIYNGTYIDIAAESTEKNFIEAKAVAIRETLIMLGAYSAEVVHTVKHSQESDLKMGATGKKSTTSGSAEVHKNETKTINLESTIRLEPFCRQTKSVEEIRNYIFTHGLGSESTIIAWLDRLERDGKLEGPEEIDITFLEELAVARDAALNLQLVKCELGFKIESLKKETHQFVENISVNFGG